jgi:hypothetical protein
MLNRVSPRSPSTPGIEDEEEDDDEDDVIRQQLLTDPQLNLPATLFMPADGFSIPGTRKIRPMKNFVII